MSGTAVTVFTLGGTISACGGDAGGRLSGEQVLASVGPLDAGVQLVDFRRVPSASISYDDLVALAARVDEAAAAGRASVVVQGTDSIEETAFFLDLVCRNDLPVVVTGAMRRPDLPGADGPANLAAAVACAASPDLRGLGVVVVLADEVHAARHVRKTHTTSVATFASPGAGPLGHVVEGRPRILLRPMRPVVDRPLVVRRDVSVGLVALALGDRGELLRAAGDLYDGVVVAAFGAGHVPRWLVDPLEDLAARIPVVLASRTGSGTVLTGTYTGPGSESDLLARGLLPAGWLDPLKARVLLHCLLADGADADVVRSAFVAASA